MFLYFKYIILGWWNWLLDKISDIHYKEEFEERLRICKECECNIFGFCNKCGCFVEAKTKCEESSCPIKKWDIISKSK